mmetsp:Transcript_60521/g.192103  ORF Transcript_60521/g.192103 Transcript_60521/m.192103 type:complete len:622 (+) Transcript_60521:182-2047(+)
MDGGGHDKVENEALEAFPEENDVLEIDEALSALEAIDKYARGDLPVQRLCYIKGMAKAAVEAGYEASATVLMPLVRELSQDDDPDARQACAEQLAPLAELYAGDGSDAGYYDVLGVLEAIVTLLMDDVEEVQGAAEEALVAVAPLLRQEEQEGSLMEILQQLQEQDDEEEELRMLCVRLIGGLAGILGGSMCQRHTVPRLVAMAQDEAFRVRKAVALCVPKVCKEVRADVVQEILLPTFLALSQDEIWSVRKACAESLGELAVVVPPQVCQDHLVDVFENFANDVSHWVRTAAFHQLGPLIAQLGGDGATESLVGYYTSMAEPGGAESDLCMACAFNFPAVVVTLGRARWGELREAYHALCGALQWKVRRALACALHVLAESLGPEEVAADLLPALEVFLKDLDEVRIGVVQNLHVIIKVLPPGPLRTTYLHVVPHLHTPGGENCANWRMRHAVASQLGPLGELYEAEGVATIIFPVGLQLCRDSVADVRVEAAAQLGAVMRRLEADRVRLALGGQLAACYAAVRELATSPSHVDRQVYVAVCAQLAGALEPAVMVAEFLPLMLSLAADAVPNVRMPLAEALSGAVMRVEPLAALPDVRACLEELMGDRDRDVVQAACVGG